MVTVTVRICLMSGRILQINTSDGGVPKRPLLQAYVNKLGVDGDDHAHPQFHGGPEKALLLIGIESIEEMKAAGHPVYPGALGENLTTEGLDRRRMRLGQRYNVGSVILQLTRMRVPCKTLDVYGPSIKQLIFDKQVKEGDVTSARWGLAGFYAAVLQEGEICQGDIITLLDNDV
jgi:MOSC domain-containing protein YiiM